MISNYNQFRKKLDQDSYERMRQCVKILSQKEDKFRKDYLDQSRNSIKAYLDKKQDLSKAKKSEEKVSYSPIPYQLYLG